MTPINYFVREVARGGIKVDEVNAAGRVEVERWGNVRWLGRGACRGRNWVSCLIRVVWLVLVYGGSE